MRSTTHHHWTSLLVLLAALLPFGPARAEIVQIPIDGKTRAAAQFIQGDADAPAVLLAYDLLEWQGPAYLEQQTQRNWNAGLWQFPTALRADRDLQSRPLHSKAAPPPSPLFSIRHSITRHQIHAQVFHLRGRQARRAAPQSQNGGWFGWNDIPELALPSLHRKIYEQWKARCAPAAPTVR